MRILLIWQYWRKDWVEVFESLSNEFDFVFCAEVFRENSTENVNHFAEIIYWSQYKNAQEMLKVVKPFKIIFMGLESLHTSSLIYAAQKFNIETYYLQHGLYYPLKFYRRIQKTNKSLNTNKSLVKNKNHGLFMLSFYLKTFKFNIPALKYLFRFIWLKKKMTQTEFLIRNKFKYRIANKYIVFTKSNANYLKQRDDFSNKRFVVIGNPSLDKYFGVNLTDKKYILLIDNPLVEVVIGTKVEKRGFSEKKVNEFYKIINEYAKSNNLNLFIKLHPFNYKSSFYFKDKNIRYFQSADKVNLVSNATKIVSFSSSLALPAIVNKDFLLVRTNEDEVLLNDLESYGMSRFPHLLDFKREDIKFRKISTMPAVREKLIQNYLYEIDGLSTIRLKNILSS